MINPITLLIAFHLLITGRHTFTEAPARVCAGGEAATPRSSLLSFIVVPKRIYTCIVHHRFLTAAVKNPPAAVRAEERKRVDHRCSRSCSHSAF